MHQVANWLPPNSAFDILYDFANAQYIIHSNTDIVSGAYRIARRSPARQFEVYFVVLFRTANPLTTLVSPCIDMDNGASRVSS